MKISRMILSLFAVSMLVFSGPALAEMIQGQVTSVNPDDNTFALERVTPEGEYENIDVSVRDEANFRGEISSLAELEVGDEIRADADKPTLGLGKWQANWVESTGEGMAGEL